MRLPRLVTSAPYPMSARPLRWMDDCSAASTHRPSHIPRRCDRQRPRPDLHTPLLWSALGFLNAEAGRGLAGQDSKIRKHPALTRRNRILKPVVEQASSWPLYHRVVSGRWFAHSLDALQLNRTTRKQAKALRSKVSEPPPCPSFTRRADPLSHALLGGPSARGVGRFAFRC